MNNEQLETLFEKLRMEISTNVDYDNVEDYIAYGNGDADLCFRNGTSQGRFDLASELLFFLSRPKFG